MIMKKNVLLIFSVLLSLLPQAMNAAHGRLNGILQRRMVDKASITSAQAVRIRMSILRSLMDCSGMPLLWVLHSMPLLPTWDSI